MAPPPCGGLPFTGGPGCAIPGGVTEGISSRAAPFPMNGKGRGDKVFPMPKLNIREQMAAYKEVIDRSSLEGERLHPRKEVPER